METAAEANLGRLVLVESRNQAEKTRKKVNLYSVGSWEGQLRAPSHDATMLMLRGDCLPVSLCLLWSLPVSLCLPVWPLGFSYPSSLCLCVSAALGRFMILVPLTLSSLT